MVDNSKDNGSMIKCMEKVNSIGQMEKVMMDNISMMKNKDLENSIMEMAHTMREIGIKEDNMEEVNTKERGRTFKVDFNLGNQLPNEQILNLLSTYKSNLYVFIMLFIN